MNLESGDTINHSDTRIHGDSSGCIHATDLILTKLIEVRNLNENRNKLSDLGCPGLIEQN